MSESHDIIDGGSGGDCIVLAGTGTSTVTGGDGGDHIIRVPEGTSDAAVEEIFEHCGDPAFPARLAGKPSAQTNTPPAQPHPLRAEIAVPNKKPVGNLKFSADANTVGILCAALIAIAVVVTKAAR